MVKAKKIFRFVLIKPSHYDADGYVIQWVRSAIPSNTLATLNGLAVECASSNCLGDDVEIVIDAYDETNSRIRPQRIIRDIQSADAGMVGFVGVQSNQFPRTMDMARPLRAAGLQVVIGGFHVSGCISMLSSLPTDIQETVDLGISIYAGEAEGRLEEVLQDAWRGELKPIYNKMDDLPGMEGATAPILPPTRIKRTAGAHTSFDAGRGCPYQCSFCTIINVQGRKSRYRSADDVEAIIRSNLAQGVNRFFITDDNFRPQQELGADLRPPDRAARGRGPGRQVHHPGRHPVPQDARISSRRRGAPAVPASTSGWKTSIPTTWSRPRRTRTRSPNTAPCSRCGKTSGP